MSVAYATGRVLNGQGVQVVDFTKAGRSADWEGGWMGPAGATIVHPTIARAPSGKTVWGAYTLGGSYWVNGIQHALREGLSLAWEQRSSPAWGGDYAGLAIGDDGTVFAAVADASLGHPHIVLVRAPAP